MKPAAKLSGARLAARARAVRLFLFDVDAVLTDGLIYHFVDPSGELVEFKGVHSHDSLSLHWLADAGLATGAISGRSSRGLEQRLKMLKCRYIYQGRLDKAVVFAEVLRLGSFQPGEVLYIGDDLPDLPVLRAAGLGVAPANARPEAKSAAAWVTRARGGEGVVREAAELVLKAQGRWDAVLSRFIDSPGSVS